MKLKRIISWLDRTLKVADFDDVSNNGLQAERDQGPGIGDQVRVVAFAVDASVRAVEAAAKAGAQLLVVHHGISWGGGIRRLTGGIGSVVRAATKANLAIAAYHLPLDAHPALGNNAQLAKYFGLKKVKPAFSYHGNVIGVIGENRHGQLIGICSGGAGEFAEEAKNMGCGLYVTGEASWGDVIAAENCGMKMICAGHYETEVFGVRALAKAMKKALKVRAVDLTDLLKP
ncbi:MAG: Nif3-like dinuclear metal center hexameric protein [Kiritimatiellae bacterium]|nr:Nif3-like dinuclear metal center hexameric protein [Kiritimatiellia bacterium]MBR2939963.1 Nif3-like dinuclear metal center hexameric protein [Kiritimatiellia bacterium]